MIYLVTANPDFKSNECFTVISVKYSKEIIASWKRMQVDTETLGRDAHIGKILSLQLGNDAADTRIVIDCTTIDVTEYKEELESKLLILQNGKFDLQFFYTAGIIPNNIYDIMVVEQFLHLGYHPGLSLTPEEYKYRNCNYPYHEVWVENKKTKTKELKYKLSYALDAIAKNRLGIHIDKTVRGEIAWRGLDTEVILYGAGDITPLEKIMNSQIEDLRKIPNAFIGAKIECDFVPCVAYLEWCGIKLDEQKWKAKMEKDNLNLRNGLKALNDYCLQHPALQKWVCKDVQLDLFQEVNTEPYFNIDWQKDEAKEVFKKLGFDLSTISKTTGEETESVTEKLLATQKGIDDTFLKLYLDYQGYYKVTTSFGQGHLNAINPITGRIHTVYRSIGAVSGRMSSGSNQPNTDLAKLKNIPEAKCTYPNMQQLPHDAETRACFISEPGNKFISCDYSAMEARIGADVYNEHKLLDEFLYGSGDTHAAYAKAVFAEELKDIETKDIKEKRPDLRSKVKSIEFAVQFGSDGTAVAPQLAISVEEARQLVNNLLNGMSGLKTFKKKGSQFVLAHGYVPILAQTGHRGYWFDWDYWKQNEASHTSEFWEDYKANHKGTGDEVCKQVKEHFQAKSKWCDRMSLNLPTQGGGAVCLKIAVINIYKWIIEHNYWGVILFCNFTHDEINSEAPNEIVEEYTKVVTTCMEEACARFYHKLPIPAQPEVSDHWVH